MRGGLQRAARAGGDSRRPVRRPRPRGRLRTVLAPSLRGWPCRGLAGRMRRRRRSLDAGDRAGRGRLLGRYRDPRHPGQRGPGGRACGRQAAAGRAGGGAGALSERAADSGDLRPISRCGCATAARACCRACAAHHLVAVQPGDGRLVQRVPGHRLLPARWPTSARCCASACCACSTTAWRASGCCAWTGALSLADAHAGRTRRWGETGPGTSGWGAKAGIQVCMRCVSAYKLGFPPSQGLTVVLLRADSLPRARPLRNPVAPGLQVRHPLLPRPEPHQPARELQRAERRDVGNREPLARHIRLAAPARRPASAPYRAS
jgi:hypothetical protein